MLPKKSSKLNFLTFFLTLISFSCFLKDISAQNPNIIQGYYIPASGAKITGTLNIAKWRDNSLKFRPAGEKQWRKLKPADIQEAGGNDGVLIVSHGIIAEKDTSKIFIFKMLEGYYSLYEGKDYNKKTRFFVKIKNKKEFVSLRAMTLPVQLQTLFQDCPGETITAPEYSRSNLIKQVKKMNKCSQPEQSAIVFDRHYKPKIAIGPSLIYYNMTPQVKDDIYYGLFGDKYHTVNKISGGLSAKINFLPAFGLSVGLNYIDKSSSTDSIVRSLSYEKIEPGKPITFMTNFFKFRNAVTYKQLEVPVMFNFNFGVYAKFSPFLSLGTTFWFPLNSKHTEDWGYPFNPPGDTSPLPTGETGHLTQSSFSTRKFNINYSVGIGLRSKLSKKRELECRIDYFRQYDTFKVGIEHPAEALWELNTNRLQLSLNYYFLLEK